MYKNKGLKRSYIFAYIMVLFGLMVPVMLAYKVGLALSIIFLLLVLIDLVGLIVSHVYYTKDEKIYSLVALCSISLFDALTLCGLIMELVYTLQGYPATYAWVMLIITFISGSLISLFYYLDYKKKKIGNN